ncbi:Major Facilitator Superfamily (plasmid) [Rubrobacter radiotolerans]|uniref:MFS transporter n=1 Tax=Rubrobacter radiotolerans TaxID=42256 RepID=A0A023X830_RUBRA|nr:MFS transporter [Rubrobacter radiotolerans]AHY48376.1 Major Facilitator Superfamily [Rubrobacter radiotolerans]MDX5895512.1 MFS transporter [Rubrobacter radiotolerans]SMC01580.1 Predicted arabinose efflux permease, MFS family [Rubrobacter radiotolerans DSM 5868]
MNGRSALGFVVLFGVVSLLADMTYEGARSITGPYLAFLGASAAAAGLVAGAGEFVGYALRLVFGYLTDRTGRFWAITIWGYAITFVAVPLLALAGSWEVATLLIVAERLGKAIRTPARDAMLSHAASGLGRGWGFGLHEALDQTGAVIGPLMVAAVLYFGGGYSGGFGILLFPAALATAVLLLTRYRYPRPRELEEEAQEGPAAPGDGRRLPQVFWLYMAFVAVGVAGYPHFQLISYHFGAGSVVPAAQIPVFFSIAMGVDALVALLAGRVFDRAGLQVLLCVPLLALPIAPLAFSSGYWMALAGTVLWGAVMGVQESTMRAAVAGMSLPEIRGTAYGVFNTAFGLFWFAGSALMGLLYEASINYLIVFSVGLQLLSVPLLVLAHRKVLRG